MEVKTLAEIFDKAKQKNTLRLAVAAAEDKHVLEAVQSAWKEDIIIPVLIGDKKSIESICKQISFDISGIEIINEPIPKNAAQKAVSVVKKGNADILMKGMVSTGVLLKAVLDKESGIRKREVLSHVAFFESPYYHKLIAVTDAAMNIAPEFPEKTAILENAVEAMHKIGIQNPKVAVLCAVETVNPKMEETMHAAMLAMMNRRGQIKGCTIEGPLALDNAVSKEAADHKEIISDVAGDADLLFTPEIVSGNILYKAMNFLGGATSAAIIMGAKKPVVLTSRADSEQSKLMSIALAAAMD